MARKPLPIAYPEAELAELARVLETTTTNAVKRAGLMRLTPVCERCGGCGQYSFNQVDGTRCYGCGGAGHVIPRAKDLPTVIEVARRAVAEGELARYLDRIEAAKVAKAGTDRLLAAYSATNALQCWHGWAAHGVRNENLPGNGAAVRAATHAMHAEVELARDAIKLWQYPAKGTTPTERQELAVAARAAIETALVRIPELDIAPTAELVEFVRERQLAAFESRKRGPWPPRAGEEPELYSGEVA